MLGIPPSIHCISSDLESYATLNESSSFLGDQKLIKLFLLQFNTPVEIKQAWILVAPRWETNCEHKKDCKFDIYYFPYLLHF